MLLKQSTAATILIGPILDSTGAAKTDEAVANIRLAKNGGTPAAPNASATLTHSHTGNYLLALTASDADTLGHLQVSLNSGTNAMAVQGHDVITANAYDSLVLGTDRVDAEVDATVNQAAAAAALNAYDPPTKAEMDERTLPTASYGTATNQTSILGYVDCLPATWVIPGTLTAAQVWEYATRALTDKAGFTLSGTITTLDALNTSLSSTHGADSWATATGFSTHSASDVVTALGTGSALTSLASATNLATANTILAKLDSAMALDGAVYQFTANALENAPGGTSSVSVTFTPVAVTVSAGAITDNAITQYQHAAFGPFVFTIVDSAGAAVDLSASSLTFVVYLPGSESTVLWQLTTAGGEITIGGASNNQVTVTDDGSNTAIAGVYRYVLWDMTNDLVRARGTLEIVAEADVDTT